MNKRLEQLLERYRELEIEIQDPNIIKDQKKYREIMREHAHLAELDHLQHKIEDIENEISDTNSILETEKDADLCQMAEEELENLELTLANFQNELKLLLIPRDPLDEKNIIMEIRGGAGGDEAALFAADLYRMYQRFAEEKSWKTELMDSNETELGGLKEVVFSISGKNVYENLRYESGVHRVQRVPDTESSGRIHTSTVTVAVLPEAEETEIDRKSVV